MLKNAKELLLFFKSAFEIREIFQKLKTPCSAFEKKDVNISQGNLNSMTNENSIDAENGKRLKTNVAVEFAVIRLVLTWRLSRLSR